MDVTSQLERRKLNRVAQNSGLGFLILSSFRLKLQVSIQSQRETAANHLLSYERESTLSFWKCVSPYTHLIPDTESRAKFQSGERGLPKKEVLIKLELLKEKEVQMHVPPNYGLKPAAAKTESILPKDAGTRRANRATRTRLFSFHLGLSFGKEVTPDTVIGLFQIDFDSHTPFFPSYPVYRALNSSCPRFTSLGYLLRNTWFQEMDKWARFNDWLRVPTALSKGPLGWSQ
ncbi:hypothetical protein PIB30_081367 [Stylosanthes scabra]|uniref:Uncharacterized protein n=1 Tax=Stylosanthes scabra TaxID=79078 RepID=A0ABU6RS17_9FABA|nr:hypothetical protein [Stylosanthes scabra]